MTYQKFKNIMVEERGTVTDKKLRRMLTRLFLFYISICLCLGVLAYALVGIFAVVLLIGVGIYMFSLSLDVCSESDKAYKGFSIVSWFWFIPFIGSFVVTFVLSGLNFL